MSHNIQHRHAVSVKLNRSGCRSVSQLACRAETWKQTGARVHFLESCCFRREKSDIKDVDSWAMCYRQSVAHLMHICWSGPQQSPVRHHTVNTQLFLCSSSSIISDLTTSGQVRADRWVSETQSLLLTCTVCAPPLCSELQKCFQFQPIQSTV